MQRTPSKWVAAFLGILFGTFGLHKFYIGEAGTGAVMLIASLLLSWTIIVPLGCATIGFFQGLSYTFYEDEAWERRFGKA